MVQLKLPGMPHPINLQHRFNEYEVQPLGTSDDGFRIVDNDDNPIAIFAPMGEEGTAEANRMLIQAMVETFNAVQQEIMEDS